MRISVNVPHMVRMLEQEMSLHIQHNQFEQARERLAQISYIKETCGGDTYDKVVLAIEGIAVRKKEK